MSDSVNHPAHYTSDPSGVECIEITQYRDFCVGNAIKYLWRAGLKASADKSVLAKEIEDLEKAKWYIDRKIKMLREGGAAYDEKKKISADGLRDNKQGK